VLEAGGSHEGGIVIFDFSPDTILYC